MVNPKYILILTMTLIPISTFATHNACSNQQPTFPFQNISLNQGCTLTSNYAFGSHPMIFCYASTPMSTGKIIWPYKGIQQSATIPISLVTNGKYQGSFADGSGTITIQNTANTPVIFACQFAL